MTKPKWRIIYELDQVLVVSMENELLKQNMYKPKVCFWEMKHILHNINTSRSQRVGIHGPPPFISTSLWRYVCCTTFHEVPTSISLGEVSTF